MSAVVHCRRAPYDVYVGRGRDPRTGAPGEWGNPFSHRPSRVPGVIVVGTVAAAVSSHKRWIYASFSPVRSHLSVWQR